MRIDPNYQEVSAYEDQTRQREPHADYASNLSWSFEWLKENEPEFPRGVRAMITTGDKVKEFMTFIFTPPRDWYGCGFASLISMQQPQSEYFSLIHIFYQRYCKLNDESYYKYIIKA